MVRYTTKGLQKVVPKMREKEFYVSQKQRKIDWPAYTVNQVNDIVDTLRFIRKEVDKVRIPNETRGVGRPPTDERLLAKAILFVEAFGFPERKAEGWVALLGPHLGIHQRIDDRVLGKAYDKISIIRF